MTQPAILNRLGTLGDETRTRLLALLERSEFTVSELCAVMQLPQPTVSRHLRTLSDEGWARVRTEGRNRHYRLAPRLDESARALWELVHAETRTGLAFRHDAERARRVLADRRLRSEAFFADAAGRWDDLRAELFGAGAASAALLGLVDPSWTVADLGVGTGTLVELVAPVAGRVIGVDRSEQMLAAAAVRLEAACNVELRRGALEALPIADDEVDLALLALVLHYVVDPGAVLAEVRRTLRPGGRVVVLDMRTHERGVGYAEQMGHVWPGFDESRMRGWLDEAGLVEARVTPLPPDPRASGPPLFLASARRR